MLEALLVASLCSIPSLPSGVVSEEKLNSHLTEVMHSCYGYLGPEILCSKVDVSIQQPLSFSIYDKKTSCGLITPGKLVLESLDSSLIISAIGHEVGHVKIESSPELRMITSGEEREYIADMIAAKTLPQGSCTGARLLGWILDLPKSSIPSHQNFEEPVRRRVTSLRASCALEIGFWNKTP